MLYTIVLSTLALIALVMAAVPFWRRRQHKAHHRWNNARPKHDLSQSAAVPSAPSERRSRRRRPN